MELFAGAIYREEIGMNHRSQHRVAAKRAPGGASVSGGRGRVDGPFSMLIVGLVSLCSVFKDKTIKLWKITERDKRPEGYNLKDEEGKLKDLSTVTSLQVSGRLGRLRAMVPLLANEDRRARGPWRVEPQSAQTLAVVICLLRASMSPPPVEMTFSWRPPEDKVPHVHKEPFSCN